MLYPRPGYLSFGSFLLNLYVEFNHLCKSFPNLALTHLLPATTSKSLLLFIHTPGVTTTHSLGCWRRDSPTRLRAPPRPGHLCPAHLQQHRGPALGTQVSTLVCPSPPCNSASPPHVFSQGYLSTFKCLPLVSVSATGTERKKKKSLISPTFLSTPSPPLQSICFK